MEYNPLEETEVTLFGRQETTFSLPIFVTNDDDTDFDFTNYSATMSLKERYDGDSVLDMSIALTTGLIDISKKATGMTIENGLYYYDLKITKELITHRWIYGTILIQPKVT